MADDTPARPPRHPAATTTVDPAPGGAVTEVE
ncbi:MAG: hypothetical protein JWR28_1604, partial [Modestobacter sp.]|nr:hypothetical protein [Modestobacter sp.]